ncbi:DNA-directed RNA polymerase subunit alpha C-terminal domain-containing protein, partial [Lentibacter algarum]|uniref:DNA-directed RNA polymerase subunit alpha C-terminal domain-containing protein n=1 Tax=Lentibacter algarum TaxID=576131 RepID=UPI0026F2B579
MNYAEFEATPIKYLSGLSTRASNCIINELGYEATIGEVIAMSDKALLRVPNFGKKSLREMRLLIEAYALRHNISIAEFKDVRRRLHTALVEGLELV